MPSIIKRIRCLPSIIAYGTITKIATEEKLGQSKVVGILVEEALIARDKIDLNCYRKLNDKNQYEEISSIKNSA